MAKGMCIYDIWAYGVKNKVFYNRCPVLVQCTIPKGTRYFINSKTECIVSESIVIEKVIEQYGNDEGI